MKVQTIRKPAAVLSSFLVSLLLVGCFGGGIDPTEDPVQPSGNEAANANAANAEENEAGLNENAAENEGNGGENNMGNNNQALNQGANNEGGDGEAVNNAADEDFLNGNNANLAEGGNAQANLFGNNPNNGANNNNLGKNGNNGLGNNNFGLNAGDQGDGALINGASEDILESPDINKGATDDGMAEAPDSVLAPVAENPTAPGNAGATTGGVVRYVTPGGSKLYDKPNGSTLRNLEQGDHPLVNDEGEWARTSDGYYVPLASLTAAPIARLKQPKEWR
ncbi:MAG: hypothetical protein M3Q07_28750 [Pseudobdellovibrionaceae bacterium]|nr:hypothetical protein [Pseudobdellovibrionaceae bacterium]